MKQFAHAMKSGDLSIQYVKLARNLPKIQNSQTMLSRPIRNYEGTKCMWDFFLAIVILFIRKRHSAFSRYIHFLI